MITWDDVTAIADGLLEGETASQDAILGYVARLVPEGTWGDFVDIGRVMLAAHFGTLVTRASGGGASSSQSVGPVISETVGPVSRTFAVLTAASGTSFTASLDTTTWGREFVALRKSLPAVFGMVL